MLIQNSKIGFMQGRLSPQVDGKIQAFPWEHWKQEFALAESLGLSLMEWTLDQERLYENPLLTAAGQTEIRALCQRHHLSLPSLTGDCFMQAPFWKVSGQERAARQQDFCAIVEGCAAVGIKMIVVPLVDHGRLENLEQEERLVSFLKSQIPLLAAKKTQVIFESDFVPQELARFIGQLDAAHFGINYDIGNSAALGFLPKEEFKAYGERILNVHVKDRPLNNTTVPLGSGNADFDAVFAELAHRKYAGNYILQTARATEGDHAGVLSRYRDMTINWLNHYAA